MITSPLCASDVLNAVHSANMEAALTARADKKTQPTTDTRFSPFHLYMQYISTFINNNNAIYSNKTKGNCFIHRSIGCKRGHGSQRSSSRANTHACTRRQLHPRALNQLQGKLDVIVNYQIALGLNFGN